MRFPRWILLAAGAAVVAATVAGCSKSAQTYLERGNAQLEKGNVDAAVLEYRNAVAKDAMFAPARLEARRSLPAPGERGRRGRRVGARGGPASERRRRPIEGWRSASRRPPGGRRQGPGGQGPRHQSEERGRARAARQCAGRPHGPRRRAEGDAAGAEPRPAVSPPDQSGHDSGRQGQSPGGGSRVPAGRRDRPQVGSCRARAWAVPVDHREVVRGGGRIQGRARPRTRQRPGQSRARGVLPENGPRRRGRALFQEDRGSLRHRGGEARACGLLRGTEAAGGCHGRPREAQRRAAVLGAGQGEDRRHPARRGEDRRRLPHGRRSGDEAPDAGAGARRARPAAARRRPDRRGPAGRAGGRQAGSRETPRPITCSAPSSRPSATWTPRRSRSGRCCGSTLAPRPRRCGSR